MASSVEMQPPRTIVRIRNCAMSYRRDGAGTPLLFLHGEDGVSGWDGWAAALARTHDVVVPDHPAFGFSESPDWLDDVHDLAYFYLDFIERLGLERVDLVGHGLGGWIACEIAVRDRSRLRSLTLVDSGGIRLSGVPKLDRFIIPPQDVVRAGFADQAMANERLTAAKTPDEQDVDLRNRFAVARLAWQPRHDLSLPKWMHRITIPTHVVWGADDRVVPAAYAADFARLIPGAQTTLIPRCGHFPQYERPAAFIAALTTFFAGLA